MPNFESLSVQVSLSVKYLFVPLQLAFLCHGYFLGKDSKITVLSSCSV